jgi:acetylornithine deacetylase/succinyl-diaminopimelate desuccinylase-like protein
MAASDPAVERTSDIDAEDEAVRICRDLLRLDTSNYGGDEGPGERAAAEYIAAALTEVGLDIEIIEPRYGRTTVMARWEGGDSGRPGLLVHAHTDVVPADADAWHYPPFSGELADDCLWGRGAVDMKYFVAQTLAVVRSRVRAGRPPSRDVVLAFVADEEAGGGLGARWLVENRLDLFEGVTRPSARSVATRPPCPAADGCTSSRLRRKGPSGSGSQPPGSPVTRPCPRRRTASWN